ncbi:MAG TPA: sulfite exporter TauE/SafE family protein [Vicinamibacterales bacterium]|nr:sulfite exporter TauE/SafE family protein [Vicinamibacterales bacterium]
MDAKGLLFIGLGLMFVVYVVAVARGGWATPTLLQSAIGFVTAFFDTLGIGSFATSTAAYKLRDLVPVRLIPGTLNVGHAPATIAQALIYTSIVPVDPKTLVLMIVAASAGAWIGAGVVVRWPRRTIQVGMGIALLGAATLMLMQRLHLFPGGGGALGLSGALLWLGLAGNFALGALMMLGIGLYAPCMILVSLLGMNPTAAFPIMMGSCAFLMPISSMRFVKTRTYHVQAALGLALGGVPAVLIAAGVFWSLPLVAVHWLVIVVVIYTSMNMLVTAGIAERQEGLPFIQGGHA